MSSSDSGPTRADVSDVDAKMDIETSKAKPSNHALPVGAGHGFNLILLIIEKPMYALCLDLFVSGFLTFCIFSLGIQSASVMWLAIEFAIFAVGLPLVAIFSFLGAMAIGSLTHPEGSYTGVGAGEWEEFVDDKTGHFSKYKGKKIPAQAFYEAYMTSKVDLKQDFLQMWMSRNRLFAFRFTWADVRFALINIFFKGVFKHSKEHDHGDIGSVYNRGNDFYAWFLGETMVYTSGIFQSPDESLEVAQTRKLDMVCQSMQMKEGDQHLDIGCGWGTLVSHAAKNYGTKSTGVSLAKEQIAWGKETAKKYGVADKVEFICKDYREIPQGLKFDCITCIEMAEHVGIKNFHQFLLQVKGHLKDDGLLYMQIAGLRRAWQYEDLIWGMFMDRYIFPGADSSCPLGFVTDQLERAGFEVHRVENTGVHYSATILKWYENWQKNKEAVVEKYGSWWFRLWTVFLGWSTTVAAQGSSTVFMITCNINHKDDVCSVIPRSDAKINRSARWIGKNPIATQQ